MSVLKSGHLLFKLQSKHLAVFTVNGVNRCIWCICTRNPNTVNTAFTVRWHLFFLKEQASYNRNPG